MSDFILAAIFFVVILACLVGLFVGGMFYQARLEREWRRRRHESRIARQRIGRSRQAERVRRWFEDSDAGA